ncbi:MAG: hypothetical protein HeimAB125_05010 [Candidatus Heimdallarchaeota archaeon AB_125]|nr:MAG: hypothetical protein HeimAB125_05010 [Candidatus Heimdallarchaeota archaeon AB_125]
MKKIRSKMFTLTVLVIISMSLITMSGLVQSSNDTMATEPSILSNPITPISEKVYLNSANNFTYGYNASAIVNRTVEMQTFGTLGIIDSIEVDVYANTSLTYFNYTLPNINTDNITFISFRVSNASYVGIGNATAMRDYTFQKYINYTTFRVPFNIDLTSIGLGAQYFVNVYAEFAYPYTFSIVNNEQVLKYQELFYPLLNDIPIVGGLVWVEKQGGDIFLDDVDHVITPNNSTEGITLIQNSEIGLLKWDNVTRHPFNYSQSYSDDLMLNVFLSSVSTGGDVENPANTVLFKSSNIHRTIEIDPFGLVRITESQTLVFLGPEKPEDYNEITLKLYALNAFPVIMPVNSTVIDLYDEVGSLNQLYQLVGTQFTRGAYNQRPSVYPGHDALIIFPRTPLFHGDTMDFTIIYSAPLDTFTTKETGSINYKFKFEPCSIVNWTVDELTVDVILPKGAVYGDIQYNNPDPYQDMYVSYDKKFKFTSLGFKRILSFKFTQFSGNDNAPVIVNYRYSRLNILITYFFQVIVVGVIFAIYLGIRWSTKKAKDLVIAEVDKTFIPVDEIEEFVKQYEEVLSLRERLRETRSKVAAKKLKAKEGKDLIAKLETRQRAEEIELKKTKETLITFGGNYKEYVQKIEIAERKLFEERRNLRMLRQEYRVKKSMTRESYMKLVRERTQTIEKLKNEIDSHLISLRMLLEP